MCEYQFPICGCANIPLSNQQLDSVSVFLSVSLVLRLAVRWDLKKKERNAKQAPPTSSSSCSGIYRVAIGLPQLGLELAFNPFLAVSFVYLISMFDFLYLDSRKFAILLNSRGLTSDWHLDLLCRVSLNVISYFTVRPRQLGICHKQKYAKPDGHSSQLSK